MRRDPIHKSIKNKTTIAKYKQLKLIRIEGDTNSTTIAIAPNSNSATLRIEGDTNSATIAIAKYKESNCNP